MADGAEDKSSFRFYVDPGRSSTGQIADLFGSMSDLNRTFGGFGLQYELVSKANYTPEDREITDRDGCLIPVDVRAV